MAFDLEKEEAKYREERTGCFTSDVVKQESALDEMDDESSQAINESAKKIFRETFMWSAFFGGPIISYIAHRSEIRRSGKSYFWVVFGICIIPRMIVSGLIKAIGRAANKLTISPYYVDNTYYIYCFLEMLILVAFYLFMAYVAAQRFGKICPYYNVGDYNQKEKKGVIVGASLWILLQISLLYFSIG